MNVLSLFDGMSCGRLALQRAGFVVDQYFASEIDKHAIKVARANFPEIIQLGDVERLHYTGGTFKIFNPKREEFDVYPGYHKIDLLLGGSPCQGFSFAGDGLAFDDPRSRLFFEYVRLLKQIRRYNPKVKFLLENVPMKAEHEAVITEFLGVEPVRINSALVSAQKRKRLYWTNIRGITQPADRGLVLTDILETQPADKYNLSEAALEYMNRKTKGDVNHFEKHRGHSGDKSCAITATFSKGIPYGVIDVGLYLTGQQLEYARKSHKGGHWHSTGTQLGKVPFPTSIEGKAKTLCATVIPGNRAVNHIFDGQGIRRFTPLECERLQTLPDHYTASASDSQRYKMIGNGWTIDVIAHILSFWKP